MNDNARNFVNADSMSEHLFSQLPFDLSEKERGEIAQKSNKLFLKRVDSDLRSKSHREPLLLLQMWVFCSDYYFEKNRILNEDILEALWRQGEQILSKLDLSPEEIVNVMKDIRSYADIEKSLREGASMLDMNIQDFYMLKSCDVRMQRHLSMLLTKGSYSSTAYQVQNDVLEEIEDDVDDVEEDKQVEFNGNRFLEGLQTDLEEHVAEYIEFVEQFAESHPEVVQRIKSKIAVFLKCR